MYPKLSDNSYLKITPMNYVFSVAKPYRMDMVINESAFEILKLCSGTNSIKRIVQQLSEKNNDSAENIEKIVGDFLEPFFNKGLLLDQHCIREKEMVVGSHSCYYPDSIVWETTTACPLRCRHCYQGEKESLYVSRENIDVVVDLIEKYGISNVQLTGGETFLHPDMEYIIDRLLNLERALSISTSGVILNEKVKKCLKKIKNRGIVKVSIDGEKERHNNMRCCAAAYDASIKFIKFLVSEGITCHVGTTVTDQSEEEIRKLVQDMRSLGVTNHNIGPISVQGNASGSNMEFMYNQGNIKPLLKKLSEEYDTERFRIQVPQEMRELNCGCGYKLIRIKPNLDITPCPMIDLKMGNIITDGYIKIIGTMGKYYSILKSPSHVICKNCPKHQVCENCTADAIINHDQNCEWFDLQKEILKNVGVE